MAQVTGRIKTSLAFHQFASEVAEALVSFGVFMHVFRGEVWDWPVSQ